MGVATSAYTLYIAPMTAQGVQRETVPHDASGSSNYSCHASTGHGTGWGLRNRLNGAIAGVGLPTDGSSWTPAKKILLPVECGIALNWAL